MVSVDFELRYFFFRSNFYKICWYINMSKGFNNRPVTIVKIENIISLCSLLFIPYSSKKNNIITLFDIIFINKILLFLKFCFLPTKLIEFYLDCLVQDNNLLV